MGGTGRRRPFNDPLPPSASFGWEPYKRVLRRYNSLDGAERPRDTTERMRLFVRLMSEACNANLTDYFGKWGFPEAAVADGDGVLGALPALVLQDGELAGDLRA